jgi:hypothetical protein
MAAKGSGPLTKAVAAILTGVVVPVLVDLAQKNIIDPDARAERGRGEHAPSPGGEAARPAWRPVPTKAPRPAEVTHVIARGVGSTPEEAIQDALRAALRQAVAAQADGGTWARGSLALWEDAGRDGGGLVLGWRELRATKEWRLRGALYHTEVEVEVDRNALAERLRGGHVVGWGG